MATISPPTRTSSDMAVESVSGTESVNRVHRPGSDSTCTSPLSSCRLDQTTFMPMPRPETSVMIWLVEKPWRKISSSASRSESRAASSGATSRLLTAMARIACGSMPLPSSLTSIRTLAPFW